MEEKKFELTDETVKCGEHILHRIKALKNFGHIAKGDLGGYVEKEENLSQEYECWVYGNAKVYGDAYVSDFSSISSNAKIFDNAMVYDHAVITDFSIISDNAKVYGNARIHDHAVISGNSQVYNRSIVSGDAIILGNAKVYGGAKVYGDARVREQVEIYGNAKVYGNTQIFGNTEICGNAEVSDIGDYMVFRNSWSSGRYFTWTKSNDMWRVGCFYGTGEKLIKKAYIDSKLSGKMYEKYVNFVKELNTNV